MQKTLQSICVSLELAKQLKEAGYPQDNCLHYWIPRYFGNTSPSGEDIVTYVLRQDITGIAYWGTDEQEYFAAPTASELGEMLPKEDPENGYGELTLQYDLEKKQWVAGYLFDDVFVQQFEFDENQPNALAKLWLYLKKHNLLKY